MARTTFKEVEEFCKSKGWKIRRLDRNNPFGGYIFGFAVSDEFGREWHYPNLSEFMFHEINNRNAENFKWKG